MNVRQLPSPGEFVWMRCGTKSVRAKVITVLPHEVLLRFDDVAFNNWQTGHRALYLSAFEAALVRGAA